MRSRLGNNKKEKSKGKKEESKGVKEKQATKSLATKRPAPGEWSGVQNPGPRKKKSKLQTLNDEADELLLNVDPVKFGERVDAPPSLGLSKKDWGVRSGSLECVQALKGKHKGGKHQSKGLHEVQMAALQKQAIEGYRAQRRLRSGKPHAGRATMDSLRELVRKEEERQSAEHAGQRK